MTTTAVRTYLPPDLGKKVPMERVIEQSKVVDVLPLNRLPLVTIPATCTIQQALSILSFSGVTSAPVYDPTLNWFYGFFELYDVLRYLMATFVGKEPGMQVTEAQWKSFGGDLPMLRFKGSSFENHNILDIMFSAQPQLQVLPINSPLPLLLSRLTNERRVIIDSGALATFSIATRLDLIRFLSVNVNHFESSLTNATLGSLGLGRAKDVHSVYMNELTISAFHKMWQYGVPCLAVLNDSGELVANLSISDLKALRQENFEGLLNPVSQFILTQAYDPKIPPVTVTSKTTFDHCLLLLSSCRVHHVWMVDDKNKPLGIFSFFFSFLFLFLFFLFSFFFFIFLVIVTFDHCLLLLSSCRVHHVWMVDDKNKPLGVVSVGDVLRLVDQKQRTYRGPSV